MLHRDPFGFRKQVLDALVLIRRHEPVEPTKCDSARNGESGNGPRLGDDLGTVPAASEDSLEEVSPPLICAAKGRAYRQSDCRFSRSRGDVSHDSIGRNDGVSAAALSERMMSL